MSQNVKIKNRQKRRSCKLRRAGEFLTETFTFITKNKSRLFIRGTYTPVKNAAGKTIKILLTGFDTTELIKRTEELKARETELSFQLEELKSLQNKK